MMTFKPSESGQFNKFSMSSSCQKIKLWLPIHEKRLKENCPEKVSKQFMDTTCQTISHRTHLPAMRPTWTKHGHRWIHLGPDQQGSAARHPQLYSKPTLSRKPGHCHVIKWGNALWPSAFESYASLLSTNYKTKHAKGFDWDQATKTIMMWETSKKDRKKTFQRPFETMRLRSKHVCWRTLALLM